MARGKLRSPADRGRKGGKARLRTMNAEERSRVARRAALARWSRTTKAERRDALRKAISARQARRRAARAAKSANSASQHPPSH